MSTHVQVNSLRYYHNIYKYNTNLALTFKIKEGEKSYYLHQAYQVLPIVVICVFRKQEFV